MIQGFKTTQPLLPGPLSQILYGFTCTQNRVGRSSAGVYKYTKGSDAFYLKIDVTGGELRREHEVLCWLNGKLPVPKIECWYEQDGLSYLLMAEVPGHMTCDCPEDKVLELSENTAALLAEGLMMLQSVDISACPFDNALDRKLADALHNIENDAVDMDNFEEGNVFAAPMDLYHYLITNKPAEELCFTHGDYCLPNIFIDESKVTGFIDLGRAGIADKWQDIALCVRSLGYNLRSFDDKEKYIALLFEGLGISPDWDKIKYYILLDELF